MTKTEMIKRLNEHFENDGIYFRSKKDNINKYIIQAYIVTENYGIITINIDGELAMEIDNVLNDNGYDTKKQITVDKFFRNGKIINYNDRTGRSFIIEDDKIISYDFDEEEVCQVMKN